MTNNRELAEAIVKKHLFGDENVTLNTGYNWAVDAVLEAFEMNPNVPSPSAQAAAPASWFMHKIVVLNNPLRLDTWSQQGWQVVSWDGDDEYLLRIEVTT